MAQPAPHNRGAIPTDVDVSAAARRLSGRVFHTPLVRSAWLSDLTRADVRLKLENVQATGSFKLRGAFNALLRLIEARADVRTIVTASAGNHGLATMFAARQLNLNVRVHLPATAPAAKKDAIISAGAKIIEAPTYDDVEANARGDASRAGGVYLSPYDDADVIAGAGTVALEMFADCPTLDVVIAPLGGGGLLSGSAIVARSRAAYVTVIGAEAAASPVFTSALEADRVVRVQVQPTLADGLAGNMDPQSRTFEIVRAFVDRVVPVSEVSMASAMRELVWRERLVTEGAGSAAVAAVLQGDLGVDLAGRTVGVILSGRNVDADVLRRVLETQLQT